MFTVCKQSQFYYTFIKMFSSQMIHFIYTFYFSVLFML